MIGSFPCPIIYGSLVDSTCVYWQQDCGQRGACRLFDSDKFRLYFHGLTAGLMFAAFLVDFTICMMASRIQFVEDAAGAGQVGGDQPPKATAKPTANGLHRSNDDNNNDGRNDAKLDAFEVEHHGESRL